MTLEAAEIAAQRESRFEAKPALKQMMQPTGRSTLNMSWDSLIKRANRLGRSMGGPRSARRHAPAPAAPLAPPPPQASPTQESPGSLSHKALMEISPGKADRNSEGAGTESSLGKKNPLSKQPVGRLRTLSTLKDRPHLEEMKLQAKRKIAMHRVQWRSRKPLLSPSLMPLLRTKSLPILSTIRTCSLAAMQYPP